VPPASAALPRTFAGICGPFAARRTLLCARLGAFARVCARKSLPSCSHCAMGARGAPRGLEREPARWADFRLRALGEAQRSRAAGLPDTCLPGLGRAAPGHGPSFRAWCPKVVGTVLSTQERWVEEEEHEEKEEEEEEEESSFITEAGERHALHLSDN